MDQECCVELVHLNQLKIELLSLPLRKELEPEQQRNPSKRKLKNQSKKLYTNL